MNQSSRTASYFAVLLLMCLPRTAVAQRTSANKDTDPQIAAIVREVSPAAVKHSIETLVSFGNRNTIGPTDAATVAKHFGVRAAREWIKSQFEEYSKACGGCLTVMEDRFVHPAASRMPQPTEVVNIYAVLKGTDPEAAKRMYLVTGHYDSRNSDTLNVTDPAPGANDDASGTAVSLECARVLSKHKFPATLVFLAVAGEEQGLFGSEHFAQMAKSEGWGLGGALNNDIVGGNKSKDQETGIVRVFSEGIPLAADEAQLKLIRATGAENDSASRQLARYVREVATKYIPKGFQAKLVFRPDRYLRGGDHLSFAKEGFPAVRFTEYREDFTRQHQDLRTENGIEYGDLPKYVNFDYVANVARVNAVTLASLASAPAPPENVKLVTKRLENDSTIHWDAPAEGEGSITSYEVVWRPTTSAEWENVESAGKNHEMTLKRSKDNVFFGVRSVGKNGNRSLVIAPVPERN